MFSWNGFYAWPGIAARLALAYRMLFLALVSLGIPVVVRAHPSPLQDANNAIFSATQVVLVSHFKDEQYLVLEAFLGTLKPRDMVTLPGFKLLTFNKMFGDGAPVEMNERTRILLFLRPDEKDKSKLSVTDYGFAFFSRDADKVAELQGLANHAIALRQKWEAGVAIPDPRRRLEALFPYVVRSPGSCRALTLIELAKLNPLPGDYIAEHLTSYPASQRASLMLLSRQFPSDKLHAASLLDVKATCRAFDAYLAEHHLDHLDVMGHWNDGTLPESIKDSYGEVYYGLTGIANFKDKNDISFFRKLVPWLIRNRFDQSVEVCVYVMRDFPSADNLPTLKLIWDDYKAQHFKEGEESALPIDLAVALAAMKNEKAIPMLMEMLDNKVSHDTALDAIQKLLPAVAVAKESTLWSISEMKIIDIYNVHLQCAGPEFRDLEDTRYLGKEINLSLGKGCLLKSGGPPTGGDGVIEMEIILLGTESGNAVFKRSQLMFSGKHTDELVIVPEYLAH